MPRAPIRRPDLDFSPLSLEAPLFTGAEPITTNAMPPANASTSLNMREFERRVVENRDLYLDPAIRFETMRPVDRVAPPPNPPAQAGRPSRLQHREGMGGPPVVPAPPSSECSRVSNIDPAMFQTLGPTDDQAEAIAGVNMSALRFARDIERLLGPDIDSFTLLPIVREIRVAAFLAREAITKYPDGAPRRASAPPDADATVQPGQMAAAAALRPGYLPAWMR